MSKKQSVKNLLRSVQVIKYTCGAGTPEEAETNCTHFIRGECTSSFCEYRRKKQTNADRIRAMSDEELALWICGVYDIEEENGKFINGIIIPGYAPHDIEEWLQQPCGGDE